jgi:hypothetical protein
MKGLTICIICVILGIMLSTMFKSVCGCKGDIVEGQRTMHDAAENACVERGGFWRYGLRDTVPDTVLKCYANGNVMNPELKGDGQGWAEMRGTCVEHGGFWRHGIINARDSELKCYANESIYNQELKGEGD